MREKGAKKQRNKCNKYVRLKENFEKITRREIFKLEKRIRHNKPPERNTVQIYWDTKERKYM